MERQNRPYDTADTFEEYSGGMDGGTALPDAASNDPGTSDDLDIGADLGDGTGLTDADTDNQAGSYEMGPETVSGGQGLTQEK